MNNTNMRILMEKTILHKHFLPICIALAMLLRLLWIVLVDTQPVSDFKWYYDRAVEISRGNGYVVDGTATAYWPVGYPGFLGIVFSIFGESLFLPKLINVLLSIGILLLAHDLTKKFFHSEIAARTTLLLLALHPNHIAYCSLVASEILFVFLMLFSVDLMLSSKHQLPALFASGIVGGLACLTKPQFLFVSTIVLFAVFLRSMNKKSFLRLCRLFLLVYAPLMVTVAPWIVRNYKVFGDWPIICHTGGVNLLMGHNPHANGTYKFDEEVASLLQDIDDEHERDAKAKELAVDFIKSDPLTAIKIMPRKLYYLYLARCDMDGLGWNKTGFPTAQDSDRPRFGGRFLLTTARDGRVGWCLLLLLALSTLYYISCLILFAISLCCLYLHRIRFKDCLLFSVGFWIILYFTCIYLVFIGGSRFHFPIVPWIMMYVAALAEMFCSVTGRPVVETRFSE